MKISNPPSTLTFLSPYLHQKPALPNSLLQKLCNSITTKGINCERFEPKSHLKSRLSLIVQVNVVLNRTVVVDSD